ncbi:MAG: zinc ribbon domain-containing protein [Spirochaetales bacterium]|nr:zinc ribbon domain-containing protein [Spirochaetales bacterium]
MPIYEYSCGACHKDFEILVHKNSDITCSNCGSNEVSKKISSFAFSVSQNSKAPGCASDCQEGFHKGACVTCQKSW